MNRLRIEIHDRHGEAVVHIDVAEEMLQLDPAELNRLQGVATHAVDYCELAGIRDARTVLIAELARRVADDQAYRREAQRRGVLSL